MCVHEVCFSLVMYITDIFVDDGISFFKLNFNAGIETLYYAVILVMQTMSCQCGWLFGAAVENPETRSTVPVKNVGGWKFKELVVLSRELMLLYYFQGLLNDIDMITLSKHFGFLAVTGHYQVDLFLQCSPHPSTILCYFECFFLCLGNISIFPTITIVTQNKLSPRLLYFICIYPLKT